MAKFTPTGPARISLGEHQPSFQSLRMTWTQVYSAALTGMLAAERADWHMDSDRVHENAVSYADRAVGTFLDRCVQPGSEEAAVVRRALGGDES